MSNPKDDDDAVEHFPLANSLDNAILMHRDAHFGGRFEEMIDYYRKEGKGINTDFTLERIFALAKMEMETKQDLAPLLLTGVEAESIGEAKQAYKALRTLYENPKKNKNNILIADLVLSEEEDPEAEIQAIVAQKETIVPLLMELLRSETFHNPLFPGYGLAPALAAKCLGLIGDKRSIISLFESIGESDFFDDDISLDALAHIGDPAKQFLVRVVQSKPITEDNEKAAIALIKFKDDPEVSKLCLKLLQTKEVRSDLVLSTYLILVCEGLQDKEDRQQFKNLLNEPDFSKMLHQDIKIVIHEWESN